MDKHTMIGNSAAFSKMLALIEKFSKLRAPVLIEGETGTGKELAARAIHYGGIYRDKPFVPINCGAFPEGLIESELFGHLKGSFTDARTNTPGLVEIAANGTLFLDEVDALTPRAQVALLRFLQDGSYRPIGCRFERTTEVRVIAATNSDIDQLAKQGAFRTDLLYRLRILTLKMPALRDRGGDALLLARAFFEKCRDEHNCSLERLDESSCVWFNRYLWPGNIRELEGLVYREAMTAEGEALCLPPPSAYADDRRRVPDRRQFKFTGLPYAEAKDTMLEQFDRHYLSDVMEQSGGNVTHAATIAGKERRALGKLLKKYGISARIPG